MTIVTLSKPWTLDDLENHLRGALGSGYAFTRRSGGLVVAKDGFRGCAIRLEENGAKADVFPVVPSGSTHVAVSLLVATIGLAVALLVNPILGALVIGLPVFFRMVPSMPIARLVRESIERL
jgi:hypothetical protein